jgi:hypothetical protein
MTEPHKPTLAYTGFLQVVFVSMNTIFITERQWLLLVLTSFCISYLWSGNVKRIAFGDWTDRIIYSTGAAIGCGVGVILAGSLTKYLLMVAS